MDKTKAVDYALDPLVTLDAICVEIPSNDADNHLNSS